MIYREKQVPVSMSDVRKSGTTSYKRLLEIDPRCRVYEQLPGIFFNIGIDRLGVYYQDSYLLSSLDDHFGVEGGMTDSLVKLNNYLIQKWNERSDGSEDCFFGTIVGNGLSEEPMFPFNGYRVFVHDRRNISPTPRLRCSLTGSWRTT